MCMLHQGENNNQWSIDGVIVGEPMLSDDPGTYASFVDYDEAPLRVEKDVEKVTNVCVSKFLIVDNNPIFRQTKTFIVLSNDGNSNDFCDPRPDSYVFNKNDGNRFAITNDYFLNGGDTLQFEV